MTYSKLYLYFGVMARGEKKNGKETIYSIAPIGWHTLQALEEYPLIYEVKPILKPLVSLNNRTNQDVRDALDLAYKFLPDLNKQSFGNTILFQAHIINTLREKGYDCDNLIDQGLAICHPDYDKNKLL